jgi:alpha-L-fucosidase
VDGVSRNGSFDINIGPTAEGDIIDLEREPLIALGDWLMMNSEAIYGSRPWKIQAEGDIRFTARGNRVYAIFLAWPGEEFRIRSVIPAEGTAISLLGIPGELEWRREGDALLVKYPLHKPRPSQCAYAWTLRIQTA